MIDKFKCQKFILKHSCNPRGVAIKFLTVHHFFNVMNPMNCIVLFVE